MPLCPRCGDDYVTGAAVCPECGENLLLGNPRFCEYCDSQIDGEAEYCIHCGIVFEKEEETTTIECEIHAGVRAVGVCIVCGKPVCCECARYKKGKVFCDNDEHVKIYQNWAVVYSSSAEYEAEMVKANLELSGVKALVLSQVDHTYFIPMSRLAVVNVMVPKDQLSKAREVLKRLRGLEEDDEFEAEEE